MELISRVYDETQLYKETYDFTSAVRFAGCSSSFLFDALQNGELVSSPTGTLRKIDIAAWNEERRFQDYQKTDDWIYTFLRDGIYHFEECFSPELIDALREFTWTGRAYRWFMPGSSRHSFDRILNMFDNPLIDEIALSPILHRKAQCLFKNNPYIIHGLAIIEKQPHTEKTIIHYDRVWTTTGSRKDPVFWFEVSLTEPKDFDCRLQCLLCSHRLDHGQAFAYRETLCGFTPALAPKGHLSLRNAGVQHGSLPNTGNMTRKTLTIGFMSLEESLASKTRNVIQKNPRYIFQGTKSHERSSL